ncbi:MAG: glutathione S-transferase family protein [Alphaproteobacteria bacterium]|jgi:glutathione S-transferase|nr:glutathione S-transferase family protein [Alphaproteobacteria bacterium]
MTTIALWQFEVSPYCDKIRRILRLKGQAFEIREVTIADAIAGKHKAISPTGKLPALALDGTVIVDSTAIAYALEARFPNPPLIPQDPKARALMHVIEDWADESLYFYEIAIRCGFPENAAQRGRDLTAHDKGFMKAILATQAPKAVMKTAQTQGIGRKDKATILAETERHLDAIAGLLGDGEWLVGDRLTLADIAVFVQVSCFRPDTSVGAMIAKRPTVDAWLRRVEAASG